MAVGAAVSGSASRGTRGGVSITTARLSPAAALVDGEFDLGWIFDSEQGEEQGEEQEEEQAPSEEADSEATFEYEKTSHHAYGIQFIGAISFQIARDQGMQRKARRCLRIR